MLRSFLVYLTCNLFGLVAALSLIHYIGLALGLPWALESLQ